ncbi:MAG TPA: ferredoxin [Acidimicrobiales bacterium]|nr:ferredoxin [Acidimicrobiales bacterium]
MRVWIEQDYCTGDGLCADLCPELFTMTDEGLAEVVGEPGSDDLKGVDVPETLEQGALEAQAQCAGECIYTR